jgi:putative hemolysin
MRQPAQETSNRSEKKLTCFIADSESLIKEAQALRYRVFAKEMGAKLKSESEGLDYDEIDQYCDHLIVFDNINNKIAGYTRLLNQEQAQRLGRFYSQDEFDLDQILALPGRFLEVGRTTRQMASSRDSL